MKRANTAYLLVLALSAFAISCGGESNESKPGTSPSDPNLDSGAQSGKQGELCEFGSAETHIRFAVNFYTGSQCSLVEHATTTVVDDAGYEFLAVDAQCRYWAKVSSYGDTRTGMLTPGQVDKLSAGYRLSDWGEYVGEYYFPMCDNWDTWRYEFNGGVVTIINHGMCGDYSTVEPVMWLFHAPLRAYELHSSGTPLDGPVRYKLVNAFGVSDGEEDQFRNAPLWPLSTSAALLAGNMNSKSRVAEDSDAAALRVIADSYRKGEIGESCRKFAPVVDENGVYYKLFMRDMVPFEDENGSWAGAWE